MHSQYQGPALLRRWHEVRAMGLGRAWWRAGYELRKRLGLVSRPQGPDPEDASAVLAEFDPAPADEGALLEHFRSGAAGAYFRPPPGGWPARHEVSRFEDAIAAADEACRRRFVLLGQQFDFAGGEIDWHLDPATGQRWPRVPWDRIDIRSDARMSDVKYTWELNRHQHWPTLGRAWRLTGDARYPREWIEQLESWLRQNPRETGVNWASNLEHALRLISWLLSGRMMLDSPLLPPATFRAMVGTMVSMGCHIVADLDYSRVGMANNHVIGDAAGLALLGLAVPTLKRARQWRELGLRTLWQEALRQIRPDGTDFEAAACYQRFVMQFYLLLVPTARAAGQAPPEEVLQRLRMAGRFVAACCRPDGTVPQYGDNDGGQAWRLGEAAQEDFRPLLSTAAVVLADGALKSAAGGLDDQCLWLLGRSAAERWRAMPALDPPRGNLAFGHGGYFLRRPPPASAHVLVKNGPFADHSHADLLSVWMHDGAGAVLVDSGTCTYNGPWAWRTYFRGTPAHNTVCVDGASQAVAHRAFRWLFPPRARNRWFAPDGRFVFDGQHDGFRRFGVTHRRIVLELTEAVWLFLDVLTGRGRHDVSLHWHMSPKLAATARAGRVTACRDGAPAVALAAAATVPLSLELLCGRDEPAGGWHSPDYGVKTPAAEAVFSATAALPTAAATLVTMGGAEGFVAGVELRETVAEVRTEIAGRAVDVAYDLAAEPRDRKRAELGRIVWPDGRAEPIWAEPARAERARP